MSTFHRGDHLPRGDWVQCHGEPVELDLGQGEDLAALENDVSLSI